MQTSRKRQYNQDEEISFPEEIMQNKKYRIQFPPSTPGLVGLHFSFKPADVDMSQESTICINHSKGDASVGIKRYRKLETENYKGTVSSESTGEKMFALIFDRESHNFQLQKIEVMVNQLKFKEKLDS
jgi:hypothetical protein